jgi:ABC-type multidrug transport system ATPase subunit
MKRKLCFGMAMISNPKIKFLDEPSTGLDPIARKKSKNKFIEKILRSILKAQQRANKGSTLFTTQTMTEAELLCDRIAIMVNGGFCCLTNTKELKELAGGYHLIVTKAKFRRGGKKKAKRRKNGTKNEFDSGSFSEEEKDAASKSKEDDNLPRGKHFFSIQFFP